MNAPKSEADEARARALEPPHPDVVDESGWEKIAANLKTIGGAVILALIIRTCLFEAFEIEGPSMEPTLLNGDRVVVAKFLYGLFLPFREQAEFTWGSPELGDVVIIKSPHDGVDIVKRVVALGGDRIELKGEVVHRNGVALPRIDRGRCTTGQGAHQPGCRIYESEIGGRTFETSSATRSRMPQPMVVPEGHVYVLGDHRDQSNDSRTIGPIPIGRVKGKALSVYWSNGGNGLRWDRKFTAVR